MTKLCQPRAARNHSSTRRLMKALALLLATLALVVPLHAKPLKVFILAGQSNM